MAIIMGRPSHVSVYVCSGHGALICLVMGKKNARQIGNLWDMQKVVWKLFNSNDFFKTRLEYIKINESIEYSRIMPQRPHHSWSFLCLLTEDEE